MIGGAYKIGDLAAVGENFGDLAWAIAGLIAALVAGVVVLEVARRRYRKMLQNTSPEPFTLDQLRQLYRQGQLTELEFERAKTRIIQHFGAPAPKPAPPDGGGPGGAGREGTSSSSS